MITHSRHPLIRNLGIAFATAMAILFSASRADASCGDYIHYGTIASTRDQAEPSAMNHAVEQLRLVGEAATPKKPCNGPNCSHRPSIPVTPTAPPPTSPTLGKNWGLLSIPGIFPAEGRFGESHSRSRVATIERPNSIFHPPRAC